MVAQKTKKPKKKAKKAAAKGELVPADDQQPNSKRVPGRPFPKGVSGNPAGRPRKGCLITAELNKMGEDEITNKTTGEKMPRFQALLRTLYGLALGGDLAAINTILNRVGGRAPITIDHNETHDINITHEFDTDGMSVAELRQLRGFLQSRIRPTHADPSN